MIFEGAKVVGRDAIVQKLVVSLLLQMHLILLVYFWIADWYQSLPFQVIQHQVSCKDIAMTVDGGVMVFVIGQLKVRYNCNSEVLVNDTDSFCHCRPIMTQFKHLASASTSSKSETVYLL